MLTLLAALTLAAPFSGPMRIDQARVSGLWWSQELNVRRELTFAEGEEVSAAQWELLERRLWNLGVFSRVKLEVKPEGGDRPLSVASIEVEDRFPITPVVRANFGGGQFFFWLGAAHINLFGRALEGRGFYERFGDQNGFHLHLLDPRFFNQRVAVMLEGEWLSRPQPQFVMRRAAVRSSVDFNAPGTFDDTLRVGLKVEGNLDELTPVPTSALPVPVNSKALFVGPWARLGRLDIDRLRYVHGFVELHADAFLSTDPAHPVAVSLTAEGQYFWALGERFNLGGRVLAAFERGARPQDRIYVGGLDKVRGYAYSEIRAQGSATANLEFRAVAFDSTWFAVMPVVFADGGLAARDTGELQPLASAGVGLRLMVPRLHRFGVRFEVAFPFVATPVTPALKPGVNFGIWHYF